MPDLAVGRALAALAAAAALAAGAQTMYKWVDEKGVTHFSESPPPDDRKAARIEVKVTPPSTPQAPSGGEAADWKAKDADFRRRQIDRRNQEKAEGKERAKRERTCERARSRVAFLQNSNRIFRDNPDGSRTWMDEAQRAAETARAKEVADAACR